MEFAAYEGEIMRQGSLTLFTSFTLFNTTHI